MRELWRLRLNFFVLLVLSFTGGIGYSAVLSSLHQFVINPTVEELNGTVKVHTCPLLPQQGNMEYEVTESPTFFLTLTLTKMMDIVFSSSTAYYTCKHE